MRSARTIATALVLVVLAAILLAPVPARAEALGPVRVGPLPHDLAIAGRSGLDGVLAIATGGKAGTRTIASGPGNFVDPTWAPDGRRLAYVSWGELGMVHHVRVVSVNGTGDRAIFTSPHTLFPAETAWSPRGERIAFVLYNAYTLWGAPSVGAKLMVIGADGADPTVLPSAGGEEACPAWSPDGRALAWTSTTGVWVARTSAAGFLAPRRVNPIRVGASCPSWSPDGSRIAFSAWEHAGGWAGIMIVRAGDGSVVSRLTGHLSSHAPSWSPDGRWLTYSSDGIWIARSDGTTRRRLTRGNHAHPRWAPRGTTIAFVGWETCCVHGKAWTVDARSGKVTVVAYRMWFEDVRWRPVGRRR